MVGSDEPRPYSAWGAGFATHHAETPMSLSSIHFEYLESLFPGVALIPIADAGRLLGMAHQTIYNKVSDGTFPVENFLHHNRRVVRKMDLVRYLDALGLPPPIKRGRKEKSSPKSVWAVGAA